MMQTNAKEEIKRIKRILGQSLILLDEFKWLLDSVVLDFYVENHWNSMPLSWRNTLDKITPETLAKLFELDRMSTSIILPLSLLSIRVLLRDLNISRTPNTFLVGTHRPSLYYSHAKLSKLFRRQVKAKKQHEIEKMSEITARMAGECNAEYIIDFGSGLGHLSRILSYGYGLKVCCLERQKALTDQASIIDGNIEKSAAKYLKRENVDFQAPVHLNMIISEKTTEEEFLMAIKKSYQIPDGQTFNFGIVGLHPCGNLAPILINLFLSCMQAKFLNLVGCCYMKLTVAKPDFVGYPLSAFLRETIKSDLSYGSREIACHAKEIYFKQLQGRSYENLKIHSYRAALEKIILKHWPQLKHTGMKSVKYTKDLSFLAYCQKAVNGLNITIPENEICTKEMIENLKNWQKIVMFHTLRWLFAPLVESVILYDRWLYIIENDFYAEINAIFDPLISPRNHIMTAKKGDPF